MNTKNKKSECLDRPKYFLLRRGGGVYVVYIFWKKVLPAFGRSHLFLETNRGIPPGLIGEE